jgi:uncharacterized protein (TIGR03435 family)
MMTRRSCIVAAILALIPVPLAYTQEKPVRLTFEAASIKLSKPSLQNGGGGIKPLPQGQGYIAQNIPVKLMIGLMYQVPLRQIKGGPAWLDTDHYDIEARADHPYNIDDLHIMFQNLLADRFSLKFHKESKQGNVYALTVDKTGLKMKVNDSPQDFKIPASVGKNNLFIGTRISMPYFCWWLGEQLRSDDRPVIDLTGLDKNYDFTLSFMPVLPPDIHKESLPAELQNLPSIFDALRQQLGLKLQEQKGPVEYYVIDYIKKPSAN